MIANVSIIVAAYNVENYILKCLESLISQTLKNIQIIVVNDGSTDKTKEIVESVKDTRILLCNKENGGLSDARNYGLSFAKGEFVAFVDGDDFVAPDMYELMYCKAKNEDSEIVECSYFMDYENYRKIKNVKNYVNTNLKINPYNAWNKLIKREFLEKIGVKFLKGYWYEDINFFLKIIPYISNASIINKPLYHYIQRNGSIMHTVNERVFEIFIIIDDVLEFYKVEGIQINDDIVFFFTKELLISSFKRFSFYDKENNTELCFKNLDYLQKKFPNWRYNKNMNKINCINLYLKTFNSFTLRLYKIIIRGI